MRCGATSAVRNHYDSSWSHLDLELRCHDRTYGFHLSRCKCLHIDNSQLQQHARYADSSLATTAIFALAMLAKLTLTIIGMVYDQKYIIRHSGLSDACAPWLLEYVYFCQSQVSRASSRPGWFSAGIFVKGQTHFLILSICSSPLSHLHLSCSPRR